MNPTTTTTTLPFLLLLLLISTTITTTSLPILGLDSYLLHQSQIDPHSTNDTYLSLPSSLKSSLSIPSSLSPTPLLSLQVTIPIHIKLIGSFSHQSQTLLSSLISTTLFEDTYNIISGSRPASGPVSGYDPSNHKLVIKHKLHHTISFLPSLSTLLSDALKGEIEKSVGPLRSSLVSVGYKTVDEIIKRDFEKEEPVEGVYIYVMKLDLEVGKKLYAYNYGEGGKGESPAFTRCLGSVWTGKERYIWVDLGAGPVDYGPGLSGEGVLPRGEFHPLAALHGRVKSEKALLADLASLVWSAYQVLLAPPLRIPVQLYESSLIVQFIHVHGGSKGVTGDMYGLDWGKIEKTFMDEVNKKGLLLSDQSLKFMTYDVSIEDCPVCMFAISRSTNSYSSRFLFENYTLIVSEYLDSKRLHQVLSDSDDEIRRVAGIPEEEFGRVLPVYVFDLDYSKLLMLDRYHQSVAFKDMVIVVRTKSPQTVSDYSCNGRHVITQTRELERPIIGSILQSMWGVSPTHLLWSSKHNSTLVDYTWSIGHTPFGPFSETSSLSFVQKDAARRNVFLTSLNHTIASAMEVLESISAHGGDRKLLKQGKHTEFVQRWNFLKYKLEKAVSALSHLDFEMAHYYSKSSEFDLFAIHMLVYEASQKLEASLVCFKDPPFPFAAVSVGGLGSLAILYAYVKRDMIFKSKRKQF